jgi:hypothetical protein
MKILNITAELMGRIASNLIDASVNLVGYVEDVKALIAGSWASVVPLKQGGGTRLKILLLSLNS